MKNQQRNSSGENPVTRAGVTLLEVLVAMLIMTIGVLSVASLLPMGAYQAAQGRIADRAAAVGQAALRDFRIRGLGKILNSDGTSPLVNSSGASIVQDANANPPSFNVGLPVCIDPWMIAHNQGTVGAFAGMPRLSLAAIPSAANPNAVLLADQVVVSSDDLTFDRSSDGDYRPMQVVTGGVKRQSDGAFSWMAILVPATGDDGKMVQQKLVTLQIVVFNHRSKDTASEYGGNGNVDGYGGGTMSIPAGSSARPGNWAYAAALRRWYRIASIDDSGTNATLTGPSSASTGSGFTIPDGVVGVYEKTIRLEGPSQWNN